MTYLNEFTNQLTQKKGIYQQINKLELVKIYREHLNKVSILVGN